MKHTLWRVLVGVVCLASGTHLLAQDESEIKEPPPSNIEVLKQSVQLQPYLPKDRLSEAVVPTATEQEIEQHNALAEEERVGGVARSTTSQPKQPVSQVKNASTSAASSPAKSLSPKVQAMVSKYSHLTGPASSSANAQTPTEQTPAQEPVTAAPTPVEKTRKNSPAVFDPNEYRPGVKWRPSSSTHFTIYTQQRSSGIGSSNMQMIFESAYATLRRNIAWMMSEKVRAFVYQDHENYLRYEPKAKDWTRALAYPTRGEIVVYDEPGKQKELQEVFTHELTHIFTQQFFGKKKPDVLMTPTWLDEGLAVYMEDQAYNGSQGGPWAHDFRTLNIRPSQPIASKKLTSARSSNTRKSRKRRRSVFLLPFDQFVKEGSLEALEKKGKTQDWYFQAYVMVRFLLNPNGSSSPSNRMQFEQFTKLLAEGELQRDPATGYPVKDAQGNLVYKPYSLEKALAKAYYYHHLQDFEEHFWKWIDSQK